MIILAFLFAYITDAELDRIISETAKEYNVPEKLLKAIVKVESRNNPYAVYGARRTYLFDTKTEAMEKVKQLRARRVRNINVGLMQINLQWHSAKHDAQWFDPTFNMRYGALFLQQLHERFGSWKKAVAYFHAGTKARYYSAYFHKVNRHLGGAKVECL